MPLSNADAVVKFCERCIKALFQVEFYYNNGKEPKMTEEDEKRSYASVVVYSDYI